jgi:hypothetical protein
MRRTRDSIALVALAAAFACAWPPSAVSDLSGAWHRLGPSLLSRQEVAAARVGRYVYVLGGFAGSTPSAQVERLDTRTGDWTLVAPMPRALNHTAAVAHGGRLYVVDGYMGDAAAFAHADGLATSGLLEYDPAANRWSTLASPPTRRGALGAAVVGHRLYAVGGFNLTQGELASTDVYDFDTQRWSPGPALATAREHVAVVACDGLVFAIGGRTDPLYAGGNLASVEVLDPAANRWSPAEPLAHSRSAAGAVCVRGRFVVFGGEEAQGAIATTEEFDPRTRTHLVLASMPTPRHSMGAASAPGGRVLAIEGAPQPRFGDSTVVEELDPPRLGHPAAPSPRAGGLRARRVARRRHHRKRVGRS